MTPRTAAGRTEAGRRAREWYAEYHHANAYQQTGFRNRILAIEAEAARIERSRIRAELSTLPMGERQRGIVDRVLADVLEEAQK